jgi:short-subunit dehydrogenase
MLPRMPQRFANKVIWITGASSGIGASLARAFSAEGALLILSARRTQRLQALQAQLSRPDHTLVLPLDVTNPDAIEHAAKEALRWQGHIDMLVNNAGISQRSCVTDTSMDTFRHVMEVNYFGIIHLTGRILPTMIARREGHIVNISSVAGYISTPMRSAYAASKHAIRAYSNTLRAETHQHGLHVTVVCPGYIRTDISKSALRGDGTPKGVHDQVILSGLDPNLAAKRMLNGIARNRFEINVGGREILAIYCQRFLPRISAWFLPYAVPE